MKVDTELFHACMRYCEAYTHALYTQEELYFPWLLGLDSFYDDYEKERIMGFEKKRVEHAISKLHEALIKLEEDDLMRNKGGN